MTITSHDYHDYHMTITWLSWLSHDHHMTITWLSWLAHDYHMTIMTITWLSWLSHGQAHLQGSLISRTSPPPVFDGLQALMAGKVWEGEAYFLKMNLATCWHSSGVLEWVKIQPLPAWGKIHEQQLSDILTQECRVTHRDGVLGAGFHDGPDHVAKLDLQRVIDAKLL